MMEQLKRIWSFLTRPKVYWRLFSLLLAVIFWLLASGDGSFRGMERIVTVEVAIHNLPMDQVVVDSPAPIKVRIAGLSPFLNRSGEAISAHVDLAGTPPGRQAYAVNVGAPAGIEVLSVTPGRVNVETEQLAHDTFPVTLAVLGMNPALSVGEMRPVPAVVTVSGRASILERVDLVVAYLSLNEGLTRLEGSFPVQVLDAQGHSLGGVAVEPAEVRVDVEINDTEKAHEPAGEGND